MNSSQLLEVPDEPALKFVCVVLAQHIGQPQSPGLQVQVTGEEAPLQLLLSAMQPALSVELSNEGRHVLPNGVGLTVGPSDSTSSPDLLLNASVSKERRSTRSKPYLFHLFIQSNGLAGLMTQLLPRYWSLHPAYEIIREGRKREK
jgi:hypothetical protein